MLNHIVVMGRLTRNPELRYTNSGTPVASFTLAVDRDFKSEKGERGVDFIDIVSWGKSGEFVAKNFTKGQQAVVDGRLQIRDWTDNEGNKRKAAEIVSNSVYFTGSKKQESGNADVDSLPIRDEGPEQFSDLSEDDGELPF